MMGARVVKTAIAVVVAVYLATLFNLEFPVSAGLLAILGVDVTRKRSLQIGAIRIVASTLGLFVASLMFALLGFHIWVLGLYILIVFPLLTRIKLSHGIVTCSVVVIVHMFSSQHLGLSLVVNEIFLLLTGLGTATAVNFIYMPNPERRFVQIRHEIEGLFSQIFIEISRHLKDSSYVWDGKEVLSVHDEIRKGVDLSQKAEENNLFGGEMYWPIYFRMRQRQLESINRMLALVAQVYQTYPHGTIAAQLFVELGEDVKNEYYTGKSEASLRQMEQHFKQMPLPATREEFEVRSSLLQLMLELKHFLSIAKRYKKQKNLATES